MVQHMIGQSGKIFRSFAQRWHAERHRVDAIEQVIAKSTLQHKFLDVSIRGADDTNIGPERAGAADRSVFVPVEKAQ